MHLTKCHDHCNVPHNVVSVLHSIVCKVHNNISPISPFAYQICVGKLMPLSAMLVNCNVIWFSCQWRIVPWVGIFDSVWSWSRIISYRLIPLRIIILIHFIILIHLTEIFDPISDQAFWSWKGYKLIFDTAFGSKVILFVSYLIMAF